MSNSELFGPISFSVLFGIILPSVDTGTDIRLGIRLYLNGHPRWAMCVLGPVILNTILTLVACQILEKRKSAMYTFFCSCLVIVQAYPQFCVIRLIWHLYKSKVKIAKDNARENDSLAEEHDFVESAIQENECQIGELGSIEGIESFEDYVRENDCLSGELGSIEPYVESVPQAYIQTAFFWVANSLTSTVERLCYNDKERSCEAFDQCNEFSKCSKLGFDKNNCNNKVYEPYHYKTDKEIQECTRKTENCTLEFESCMEPLLDCLQSCQTNLTENIRQVDASWLFTTYAYDNQTWMNTTLAQNYEANEDDLKRIQLYVLYIGDAFIFISSYVVSVFAAAYGVTKYFHLGPARFTKGLLSPSYIGTFVTTVIFLVGKGSVLAIMIEAHPRSLFEGTCWWLMFTMAPTFVLALSLSLSGTFFRVQGSCWFPKDVIKMALKQPPVLIAPCVTPFTYKIGSKKDEQILDNNNTGKLNKTITTKGEFVISKKFSIINCIMTIISTSAGLIWKGEQSAALVLAVAFPVLASLPFLLAYILNELVEKPSICIKHETRNCDKCLTFYGFLNVISYDVCSLHHNKLPCLGENHHLSDLHLHDSGDIEKIKIILTHPLFLQKFKKLYILPQLESLSQSGLRQIERKITIDHTDLEEIQNLAPSDLNCHTDNPMFQKVALYFIYAFQSNLLVSLVQELKMNKKAIHAAKQGSVSFLLKHLSNTEFDTQFKSLQIILTHPVFLDKFKGILTQIENLSQNEKEEMEKMKIDDFEDINSPNFIKAVSIFLTALESRQLALFAQDCGMNRPAIAAAENGETSKFLSYIVLSFQPLLIDTKTQALQKLLTNPIFLEELKKILPQIECMSQSENEELSGITEEDLRCHTYETSFQKAAIIFLKAFRSKELGPLIRYLGMGKDAVDAAEKGFANRFLSHIENINLKDIVLLNANIETPQKISNFEVSISHIDECSTVQDSNTNENPNFESNASPHLTKNTGKESFSEKDVRTDLLYGTDNTNCFNPVEEDNKNKEINTHEMKGTPYTDLLSGRNVSNVSELGMLLIDVLARKDEKDLSNDELVNFLRDVVEWK